MSDDVRAYQLLRVRREGATVIEVVADAIYDHGLLDVVATFAGPEAVDTARRYVADVQQRQREA